MSSFQPVRLAYNSFEPVSDADPSLPPVLFLHGLTSCKEQWGAIPQVISNATKRKAFALDSRNHGDSEWSDYFNFDVNVDDLIHFMDQHGIKKAILVGHSMGGITAIKTALQKPDRVERIVVEDMFVRRVGLPNVLMVFAFVSSLRKAIESVPPDMDDEDTVKTHILNYLLKNLPPGLVNLAKPTQRDPEEMKKLIMLRRGADGRFQFKTNIAVLERALLDVEKLCQQPEGVFEGPALFIYGKLSPFLVGADEHHIKQHFPNATLTGIEEVGHGIHTDKPLEFTEALLECLSS